MLFKGTFLENSKMILESLNKFHEFYLEDNDENGNKHLECPETGAKTHSAPEPLDDKGSDTEVLKESEVGNDLPNEGEKKTKIKMKPNKNTTKVIMINESRLPNAECKKESESGNSVEDFEKNEVDDACEVMDTTERNFDCLNVVNLVLLIIMIFWFILIPFVMVVGNSLDICSIRPQESLRLSCPLKDPPLCSMGPQCMYSSHVLVMLDKVNIDDASWQEDMDLVEKLIKEVNEDKEEIVKKYTMNFMTGLKIRLKAVGDHDLPQREAGVQHSVKAKMTKLKMTKGCDNCCCYPHCMMNEHGKTAGTLDVDVELCKESLFPGLLDRAWDQFEDYKVQMFDELPMVQDKLMSMLHAVNIDLDQDGVDAEEDQPSFIASANTSDAMSI